MNRNLDGAYFRVCRAGHWCNICFSDLTEVERHDILERMSKEACAKLCEYLADVIKGIGSRLDLTGEAFDYDDEQN